MSGFYNVKAAAAAHLNPQFATIQEMFTLRTHPLRAAAALIAVLVGLAGLGGYYQLTHPNPKAVFWSMVSNNLSTSGVTRVLQRQSDGLQLTQYTQLNLGSQPTAHALTIFKQNGGSIVTEEISNHTTDLVRYKSITTPKKINTSSVVGKWARLGSDETFSSSVSPQLFDQSLLGVLPIGNLTPAERTKLLDYMHTTDVFTYNKVIKGTAAGRQTLQYTLNIKPQPYIALMQQFGKLVGAKEYAGIDPANFAGSGDIAITVVVDTVSRQLRQVTQASSGHVETYQAFGIVNPVALPKASLTTSELETRINALHS